MKKLIFIFCLFFLIFPFVMASNITNLSVSEKGYTYIKWGWDGTTNNASIDGLKINNVDLISNTFILSEIKDNETHNFCVYSSLNSQCNSTKADLTPKTSGEKAIDYFVLYLFFFLALGCVILSVWVRLVAFLAFIFSLLGIIQSLDGSFYMAFLFGVMTIISVASLGYDR